MNVSFPDPHVLFELAKHNPAELERIRIQHINKLIDEAPEHMKQRLRGLQFQIDCKRRLHKNPIGSCLEISRMMMNSLHSLSEALHGQSDCSPNDTHAAIFAFPKKAASNVQ